MRADLITVYHNDTTRTLATDLAAAIRRHEPRGGYRFITVDNRRINRGFARACNLAAFHPDSDAPVIGFLNPDLVVRGAFLDAVTATLESPVVITGARFGKSEHELRSWGVADWVCGASFFVTRRWFTTVNGFDEQFVWSWEETDLIRTAETQGLRCRSITLPFDHDSPPDNSDMDAAYKRYHFDNGATRFRRKWGTR